MPGTGAPECFPDRFLKIQVTVPHLAAGFAGGAA